MHWNNIDPKFKIIYPVAFKVASLAAAFRVSKQVIYMKQLFALLMKFSRW